MFFLNQLFIISGPSGSGKTTIMKQVMENEIVSSTTRPIRLHQQEVDGVDYHFLSKERFEQLIQKQSLAEWNQYAEHYYGITVEEIQTKLLLGNAYAVVEYNGMKKLKTLYPNAVSIFIYSSKEDVILQMKERGESDEVITKRLATYSKEMNTHGYYDYVLQNKNGKFDDIVSIVRHIIAMQS